MAGYKNYSISNNAIEAYKEGQLPESKVKSQIKLATKLILKKCGLLTKENLQKLKDFPSEVMTTRYTSYHHTSSKYNCTNFYSVQSKTYDLLQAILGDDLPDEVLEEVNFFENSFLSYSFTDSAKELSEKTKKVLG